MCNCCIAVDSCGGGRPLFSLRLDGSAAAGGRVASMVATFSPLLLEFDPCCHDTVRPPGRFRPAQFNPADLA